MSDYTIRRAEQTDLDRLLEEINLAFQGQDGAPCDFKASLPYLFHEARIPDHFIYEKEGRILGSAGAYPYDVRVNGVTFRTAGIGQVSCHPDHRRKGVMTAVMKALVESIRELDFTWLGGDRLRYAHFGWAKGGRELLFTTSARYLPDPAGAAGALPLDIDRDLPRLLEHIHGLPCTVLMPEMELRMLLEARGIGGWFLKRSFILLGRDGTHVYFAGGAPEEIALLIAHQSRINREEDPKRGQIEIETPDAPSPLMRVCRDHYSSMRARQPWSFRVGALAPFLEKAARSAEDRVPEGSDKLELVNTDTNEAATLIAMKGEIHVMDAAGDEAHRFTTTQLSQIFFDWIPVEHFLPDLRPDSPLRVLFPLNVHLSNFFSL